MVFALFSLKERAHDVRRGARRVKWEQSVRMSAEGGEVR